MTHFPNVPFSVSPPPPSCHLSHSRPVQLQYDSAHVSVYSLVPSLLPPSPPSQPSSPPLAAVPLLSPIHHTRPIHPSDRLQCSFSVFLLFFFLSFSSSHRPFLSTSIQPYSIFGPPEFGFPLNSLSLFFSLSLYSRHRLRCFLASP